MKLCLRLIVLALFISVGARFLSAAQQSIPFIPSFSSTSVRGYISSPSGWQRHVCRPAVPARVLRVVVSSTNGTLRTVGHTVRCRHTMVFVPNADNGRVFPTPNRSSAFSLSMQRRAIPARPGPPPVLSPPPRPERGDRTNIVVFPPRPPRVITNVWPVIVRPVDTNVPPLVVIRPDPGSVLI